MHYHPWRTGKIILTQDLVNGNSKFYHLQAFKTASSFLSILFRNIKYAHQPSSAREYSCLSLLLRSPLGMFRLMATQVQQFNRVEVATTVGNKR